MFGHVSWRLSIARPVTKQVQDAKAIECRRGAAPGEHEAAARAEARRSGSSPPPKHILNAPTRMMKEQGYGAGYQYDHDAEDGFSGQNYFPDGMKRPVFYIPVDRGHERELKKRVDWFVRLRARRQGGDG
jgi:replication-associated recombination protein RarA